jgi:hypothetical protein
MGIVRFNALAQATMVITATAGRKRRQDKDASMLGERPDWVIRFSIVHSQMENT